MTGRFIFVAGFLCAAGLLAAGQPKTSKATAGLRKARTLYAAAKAAESADRVVVALGDYREALRLLRKAGAPQSELSAGIVAVGRVHAAIKEKDLSIDLSGADSAEIINLSFRVKKILERHGDKQTVSIDGGGIDGILSGGKGEAIGSYSTVYKKRGGIPLGSVDVLFVQENSSVVEIALTDTSILEHLVQEGDMVSVPAGIPKRPYRSLLYYMSALNIEFQTSERGIVYHFRQILQDDSPELESDILELMANDVRETVAGLRDLLKDNPTWAQPLKSGRFAGISMLEGMTRTTGGDIAMFLRFIRSFPGKYMGQTWKINETYATWIINSTPLGETDLRDTLMVALAAGSVNAVLMAHKSDLQNAFIENWGLQAIEEAKKGNQTRAYALCKISLQMAQALRDTAYIGWAHFSRAKVLDEENRYEECMAEYALAIGYFKAAGDFRGEYWSVSNSAGNLNSLNRYDEALERYDAALAMKRQAFAAQPSNSLRLSIGGSLWGKGLVLCNLARYSEAIGAYQEALRLYDSVNTLESTKNKVRLLREVARVHEKYGDYQQALEFNKEVARSRRELADPGGEADALDNIANCLSKLGRNRESLETYAEAYRIQMALGLKKDAGFSRSNMGQMLWTLGEYTNAIESHKEAIALREEANDKSGQAYSWGKLAGLYKETSDPRAAIEAYNHAIALNKDGGTRADLAQTYSDMGELYQTLKDFKRAIQQHEQALAIRTEIQARNDVATSLYNIGWAYMGDGNFAKAGEFCSRALAIQKEIGDKSGQLYSMVTSGHIAQQRGDELRIAEEWYRNALVLAGETKSTADSAYCLRYIGYMEMNQGNEKAAFQDLSRALALYEESGDRSKVPDLLVDLGGYLEARGDFAGATGYFERALAIADSTRNRASVANALTSLGDIHRVLGEYATALKYQGRALEVAREVDNQWAMASAHLGLGNAHNYAGEFKSAIHEYELADSLYKLLGNEVSRATSQNNIGTIYFWGGDYDNALGRFKEALFLWTKGHIESSSLVTAKVNIGETYFYKNMHTEAYPWLAEALALARKLNSTVQVAEIQGVIGKLLLAGRRHAEARLALDEAYTLAVTMGLKERIADAASALGQLHHETHNDTAAVRYLQESITASRTIGSTKYLWEPLYTLGLVYRDREETDRAIETLKEAVTVIEEIRSKLAGGASAQKLFASGGSKVQVYETLVSLLMKSGKIEESFNYLERSNNQGLREQLGPMAAQLNDSTRNVALTQHRDLKNKVEGIDQELVRQTSRPDREQNAALIASLRQRKHIVESQYTKFVNETVKSQKGLAEYFSDGVNPLELREAKRDIPKDVAVVSYLTGEQQLYIFVATSDSVGAAVIDIPRKELKDRISAVYNVLHRPSKAGAALAAVRGVVVTPDGSQPPDSVSLTRLSEELYGLLISPIESKLKGKKKLAVIANAELNYLPFQILGQTQSNGRFRMLVDDWSVFYVVRMKVFTEARLGSRNLKIAAFGNADSSLPNAEMEVKELKKLYADAAIYVRKQATKERVLSLPSTFSAIHFATHGILDYGHIENSYLVLAPENGEPGSGHLTIDEVTQMTNLYDTRLVTLSACNTAIGTEMVKGWLINPANAFLRSGVRTVVASLWQVDDAATSILMKEFYKNLKTMDAVDALRNAQLSLMRDSRFVQPYFWAGFVLMGQWR
jgi:tetratricopeptide (TPR) repeat protein